MLEKSTDTVQRWQTATASWVFYRSKEFRTVIYQQPLVRKPGLSSRLFSGIGPLTFFRKSWITLRAPNNKTCEYQLNSTIFTDKTGWNRFLAVRTTDILVPWWSLSKMMKGAVAIPEWKLSTVQGKLLARLHHHASMVVACHLAVTMLGVREKSASWSVKESVWLQLKRAVHLRNLHLLAKCLDIQLWLHHLTRHELTSCWTAGSRW